MEEANVSEEYQKMTGTPIPRLIMGLAVPTTISMLVTNIYNTADTYFVSKIGTSASGAVGIVFSLMALYQAIGFMCGHGAGSFISRYLGAKDPDHAKIYGATSFWMSFSFGVLISAVCLIFMDPLLLLLGSTKTILPYARQYAVWIFISGPFLTASCTMNNHLRYEGQAFYSMIGLTIGGVLNIIGDPILMFTCGLGVSGAGLSTCLSQIVSFLILLHMIRSGKTVVRYHLPLVSRKKEVFGNILMVGSSSFVRQMLNALSTVFLNRMAGAYGDPAIAAMSIVGRVSFLVGSVAIGIGQGMQPVASFNYGARKYDRVKKAWHFTHGMGTALLCGIALLTFLFARPIVTWFRNDPEVILIGTAALRWSSISSLLQPTTVSCNMLLQSTGQSRPALLLASLRSGVFFIPLILTLPLRFGVLGIEIAQPIADILAALVSYPVAHSFIRSLN